jgi:hypothetical protein
MVPVTEMRKSFYLEPVVTYSNPCPPPCPPNPCPNGAGIAESAPTIPPTGIGEPGRSPGAGINESSEPPRSPRTNDMSRPKTMTPVKPIRADRVASLTNGRLQGQVVRDDRITPRANATLRFVNDRDEEVTAKADKTGRFTVELPAGEWTLYSPGVDGKPEFHSTVLVKNADDRRVTVVSR